MVEELKEKKDETKQNTLKKEGSVEDLFGVSEKDIDKQTDEIFPSLEIPKTDLNTKYAIRFVEEKPRKITTKDKEETRVIVVYNEDLRIKQTLWLSSKTLALRVGALYKKHGNSLKGIRAMVFREAFTHKKYGDAVGWAVQEITEEEQGKGVQS